MINSWSTYTTGAILLAGLPSKYELMIMGIESSGIRVKSESTNDGGDSALYSSSSKRTSLRNSNNSSNNHISGKSYQKGPCCCECNRYGHILWICDQVTRRKNINKPRNSTT
ncbi:hypothetical protein PR048_007475 [Dryococelus australis]|uniref:Uncharacterized protein n=1 Tax=Dryococelus australis TaxID=614101 RepID=A0ABQ9HUL9_9NEOP|nr:hypothetical protein PR048_007475 [Dryococelus australis]